MIVRESPKSGAKKQPQSWPPKSPHEALLSSPSGRRKYEQRRGRDSVSPSPAKRRPIKSTDNSNEDEDEDEEELELQLRAIETRLKLKKLQKARQAVDGESDQARSASRPGSTTAARKVELPRQNSEVQVPVSPIRKAREPAEQKSPARVLLGIDKGLRAQDVSLKRAPSQSVRDRGASTTHSLSRTGASRSVETPRIKSFSERLAESRNNVKEKEEKQSRIEKSRSTGFGLKDLQRDASSSRTSSSLSTTRSAQDPPPSARKEEHTQRKTFTDFRNTSGTPRSSSTLSSRPGSQLDSRTPSRASTPQPATVRPLQTSKTASKYAEISERDNSTEASSFESFSGLHLKNRTMPHNTLARALDDKAIFTIPQLLKTVKAPEYEPPDMETDYVVIGVIASKSSPLTPKNGRDQQSVGNQDNNVNQSGKFMVIRLTDLKWELDLFLFDTGFSQFWKLPTGTLVAVLNPDIMPPRQRDTGKFSLKLASSDDTIIEIGTARDLDYCHAQRKDGNMCGQWIDGRKTEYCEYHIELHVEKSKRGRMEVNTMTGFGKGPGGGGGGKFGMFGGGGRGGGLKSDELKREGRYHDRTIHETVYIAPSTGAAARLLDDEDTGFERGASRAEKHRRQLAEKEKERELAKRLGQIGRGAGSDYMKIKGADTPNLPARGDIHWNEPSTAAKDTAASSGDPFGLLNRKADDVSLAPVKRKRIVSTKSTASNGPVGWGGAFKRGILLPPEKESDQSLRSTRESSPAKKRARLLLPEKGIREPGRDSLGTMDVGLLAAMDDDDDDLDIV
ncbi:hypothetical protein BU24DRAFT_446522 [Aaosphaeria arxii CBS 175.79]|uniref:Uncharacterized protein n=1 Tax=Aaosphaeria arxii CBS 175.79 TaxID=1450172 RepID=A0A6A5YAB5_9PLEO|nr:uncharacterized protein BU24DRAFT_446522 [Aaosphaeria arxii CBS 175.79]KAF2021524.1 hypothetical protein BU24DRAFT_446522 [Aaosphaeria arxii CBS 175.79]